MEYSIEEILLNNLQQFEKIISIHFLSSYCLILVLAFIRRRQGVYEIFISVSSEYAILNIYAGIIVM